MNQLIVPALVLLAIGIMFHEDLIRWVQKVRSSPVKWEFVAVAPVEEPPSCFHFIVMHDKARGCGFASPKEAELAATTLGVKSFEDVVGRTFRTARGVAAGDAFDDWVERLESS